MHHIPAPLFCGVFLVMERTPLIVFDHHNQPGVAYAWPVTYHHHCFYGCDSHNRGEGKRRIGDGLMR